MQSQHTENALHQKHSFSQNKRTLGQSMQGSDGNPPCATNPPMQQDSSILHEFLSKRHNQIGQIDDNVSKKFNALSQNQSSFRIQNQHKTFQSLSQQRIVTCQKQVFVELMQTPEQNILLKKKNTCVTGHVAEYKQYAHEGRSTQSQGSHTSSQNSNFPPFNQQNPGSVQAALSPNDALSQIGLPENIVEMANSSFPVTKDSHTGLVNDTARRQSEPGGNHYSDLIKYITDLNGQTCRLICFGTDIPVIRSIENSKTIAVVKPVSHLLLQGPHSENANGRILKNHIQLGAPIPREIQCQQVFQKNHPQYIVAKSQLVAKNLKNQNTEDFSGKFSLSSNSSTNSVEPLAKSKKSRSVEVLSFSDRIPSNQDISKEMHQNTEKLSIDPTVLTPVASPNKDGVNCGNHVNKFSSKDNSSKRISETLKVNTIENHAVIHPKVNSNKSSVAVNTSAASPETVVPRIQSEESVLQHSKLSRTAGNTKVNFSNPVKKSSVPESTSGISKTEDIYVDASNSRSCTRQDDKNLKVFRNSTQRLSSVNSTAIPSNGSSDIEEFPKGGPQHTVLQPVANKSCNEPFSIVCFVCTDTVNSEGKLWDHLFFGPLKCSNCHQRISSCDMMKSLLRSDEKCKGNQPKNHEFVNWCTDPVEYLTYHIDRDLIIRNFCKYDKNVPVTRDEICAELGIYHDKLSYLKETVPWKASLSKVRHALESQASTSNKKEKTTEVRVKMAVSDEPARVQPDGSDVQTASGKSNVLGKRRAIDRAPSKTHCKLPKRLEVVEGLSKAKGLSSDSRWGERLRKYNPWDLPADGRYLEVKMGKALCPENCPDCYAVICPSRFVLNLKTFKMKYTCEECSLPIFFIFNDVGPDKSVSNLR